MSQLILYWECNSSVFRDAADIAHTNAFGIVKEAPKYFAELDNKNDTAREFLVYQKPWRWPWRFTLKVHVEPQLLAHLMVNFWLQLIHKLVKEMNVTFKGNILCQLKMVKHLAVALVIGYSKVRR